jgi:nucleoid DNA-binding protein
MTKTELVEIVSKETNTNRAKTDALVKAIFKAIADADEVTIIGFGKFKWKTRAARNCINPATKQPMTVPESTTLRFRPAPGLKDL